MDDEGKLTILHDLVPSRAMNSGNSVGKMHFFSSSFNLHCFMSHLYMHFKLFF